MRELWRTLSRQRWIVLGVATLIVAVTALLTWRQPRLYESDVSLRIDKEEGGASLFAEMNPLGGKPGEIQTEMFVLRSRQIAASVVDSIDLHVRVVEPALPRTQVLRTLSVPRGVEPNVYDLRRGDDGAYAVSRETSSRTPLPERVTIGTPFELGGATLALEPRLRQSPPERIRIEILPFYEAVGELREQLQVVRVDPDAQVISVSYRGTDPVLAAAAANVTAEKFIQYKLLKNSAETRSTVAFLRDQVGALERQLGVAEGRLRDYREREQIVSLSDQASEQVKRLAALQAERDGLQAERDALSQLLERVSTAARAGGTESPYRQLASFPVLLANQAVQNLLQSLTQLETQRSELLVRRTGENAEVQGINQRINELELQLYQIARNYLQSRESQIASLNRSLGEFGTELATVPARETEFARLARQGKLLEEMYTLLQTRLKEAEIKEAAQPNNARVIDTALVPTEPVAPRPALNLALALILGLVVGAGVALARKGLDTKVRTAADVETSTAGMPMLGVIPRIRPGKWSQTGGGTKKKGAGANRLLRLTPEELIEERLVAKRDPRSPASEAYRSLRTTLSFSGIEQKSSLLVVTSSMPSEGKSTTSSNLAITLAQQGKAALLVDVDLRKGLLHKVLSARRDPGLTHVLLGHVPLSDAVQEIAIDGAPKPLHFLSGGVFPPNPAELLGSERMLRFLEEARSRYDVVILDAPPVNLVTDAAILGALADATLLVARSGVTDRHALQSAASHLRHLRVPIAGIVLNDVGQDEGSYYGYYGEEES